MKRKTAADCEVQTLGQVRALSICETKIKFFFSLTFFQYSDLISQLSLQAQSVVRALDPTNCLEYFRVRSKKYEIMVAPENDYSIIVLQNPPPNME